jgi:hypothetical protein
MPKNIEKTIEWKRIAAMEDWGFIEEFKKTTGAGFYDSNYGTAAINLTIKEGKKSRYSIKEALHGTMADIYDKLLALKKKHGNEDPEGLFVWTYAEKDSAIKIKKHLDAFLPYWPENKINSLLLSV